MAPTAGRFVWCDLMTQDADAALAFYTELLGWQTKDAEMGGQPYTMFSNGTEDVGGLVPIEDEEVPSHWMNYLTVDDVDAVAEAVPELGGVVAVEPTDIPGIGRFCVVADPQGAWFSPFAFAGDGPPERVGQPPVGAFCWHELMTTDSIEAQAFYTGLVGWTSEEMEMGGPSPYRMQKRGEISAAGIMEIPDGMDAPPNWLSYVVVEDVDESTERVPELGGFVLVEPQDIPGIGRFSVIGGPDRSVLALFTGTGE